MGFSLLDSGKEETSGGRKDKKAEMDGCGWLKGDCWLSFRFSLYPYPFKLGSFVVSSCVAHEPDRTHYCM